MAEFNQSLKIPGDPSYIGYSRETQGDRSTADLIKGIGNIGVSGFVTADELITDQVKADVQEGVAAGGPEDPEDITVTPTPGEAGGETVDVFGEERLAGNAEVGSATKSASRLTEAYRQGKVSATYYWGKMASLSKQLKSRYPGYSEIIDRQFQGITGNIPATALANAKRKEYTGYLAKINEEEKNFTRFVNTNIEYLQPDYFERAKAGNPYTKMEVYERVHRLQAQKLARSAEKEKLALATSRGNLSEETAIGVAQNEANTIVNTAVADTASQELLTQISSSIKSAGQGKLPTPQEKQQLRAAFGLLRAQVQSRVEAAMRQPTGDGQHTYYSMIKDPNKVQNIVQASMAPFNEMGKLLEDDEYGLFAMSLNYTKAAVEDTKAALLADPDGGRAWRAVAAAKDLGGSQFVAQADFLEAQQKPVTGAVKAFVDVSRAELAAGQPTSLVEKVTTVAKSPVVERDEGKTAIKHLISDSVAGLTSPHATPTTLKASAKHIFGEGNRYFLRHFGPRAQIQLYDQLVSPAVTKAMTKVRETDPELWTNYKDWVKTSFLALQKANAATIREGAGEREEVNIKWDDKAKQFTTSLTELGTRREAQREAGSESFISGIEGEFTNDVKRAVTDLNRQIKLMEEILKVEGGDITKELHELFLAMNIATLPDKRKTVFQKLRNLLDDAVTEVGNETSP